MGKRKTRARPISKRKAGVPKVYDCPMCGERGGITIKLKQESEIRCQGCGLFHVVPHNSTHTTLDVWSILIDYLDEQDNIKRSFKKPTPTITVGDINDTSYSKLEDILVEPQLSEQYDEETVTPRRLLAAISSDDALDDYKFLKDDEINRFNPTSDRSDTGTSKL